MMPQYLQNVLGFTATLSGMLIFMRAFPVLLLTPLVARLATKLDFRWLLITGFVVSAIGFGAIATHMTTESDFGTFASLLFLSGVGQAMLLVPLLVGMFSSVPPIDAPKASSFISLSVQLGGSIASTMLVTIFDRRTYFHSDTLRGALTLARPAVEQLAQRHASTLSLARILQQQAVNAGFADAIFSLVPMACVGVFAVAAMRRVRAPLPGPIVLAE